MIRRRLISIPAIVVAFIAVGASLPLLFALALLVDLVRREKLLTTTRLTGFAFCYLAIECGGLVRLAWVGLSTRRDSPERRAGTYAAQRFFTGALLAAVSALFSLRFRVEGDELVLPGPLLVLVRHASLVDVLVPAGFIANRHALELHYVLKRELLVDPCLDVAGHWIPNHFVDRSGTQTAAELAAIAGLKQGVGERQGVILYPEGTRFSLDRREAVLKKLEGRARARAEELRHLLPLQRGGVLTLLSTEPRTDLLFVGHHGLEGLTRLDDIWRGKMVGRTVTIRFWRAPAAEVPDGDDARLEWLHAHWRRIDDWLAGFPS